jgi:hypothetical protein
MDRACRYSQHAPSRADSSGKAWKRSREIIELQQFHRKNAALGVPGTAFFSFSLRTSWTRSGGPSHHQTQELFFLKRALMVWFAVTLLNA